MMIIGPRAEISAERSRTISRRFQHHRSSFTGRLPPFTRRTSCACDSGSLPPLLAEEAISWGRKFIVGLRSSILMSVAATAAFGACQAT